jgi:glycosyltransferase involved in cell wall biosynthesis
MGTALYICYFGLRQPLVQTQVLPYLRELKKDGHEIILLTFEPDPAKGWTGEQIAAEKEKLVGEGIEWQYLAYHKRPSALATAYDILRGALKIRGLIGQRKIDILHGRVHVPTLMGAIARKFSRRKPKLLFDIRGFFPEEYTDAGIWPENGLLFRSVKRIEKWLLKESDGFVILTRRARDILFPECSQSEGSSTDRLGRPIEVIPCCVDLEKRFALDREALRTKVRGKLLLGGRPVYVHAGALGGLYLTDRIADFLGAARGRDPSTFAMFLTQSDPDLIVPLLRERGFCETDYYIGRVRPEDVPAYLCAADVGLSFVKAGYATQSRSPTKIPEYLACGLPLIANRGVGDVDDLVQENRIGVLIDEFTEKNYQRSIEDLVELGDVSEKCRRTAEVGFSINSVGGPRYRRLYNRMFTGANE